MKSFANNGLLLLLQNVKSLLNGYSKTSHTHSVASTSANGFMSKDDKTKLNGISTGANKTTVDSALSSSSTNPVQNKVINSALNGKATIKVSSTKPSDTNCFWFKPI